jgi:NAD(P)-dependent dehydrogenase (short-subunit alcohol dehydrogenase family)
MRFAGQVAIVTGAARGIGLAIAEALATGGAKVALFDLDLQEAQRQAERLTAGGSEAYAYAVDVAEAAQVQAAVEAVVARWGRIDILVNNAGVPGPSAPLWEVTDAQWRRTLAIDLDGVFYCCRAVVPVMLQQGYGRIVNVASIAGKEGNPNLAPYSTAKAGVIGLTKSLGKELATRGVIVNAVTPAVIETDILKDVKPEVVQYMVSRIPMGRVGQPHEVAALVAWLASRECSFSTGAVFDISGGRATY